MNQTATISLEQLPYSEAVSAFLARKPRLFIGNEWVES
jgi:phenylacetaldehyde dehydrogenase